MIVRLEGKLLEKQPPYLILDVGGVGYGIEAPMSTFYHLPPLGATCALHTHLSVREDAHQLFGFLTLAERDLFQRLVKLSGVGAKMALAILSSFEPKAFHLAIERGETALLTRIPGVGKKTAERLVVELRHTKLPIRKNIDPSTIHRDENAENQENPEFLASLKNKQNYEDAFAALVSLGYKPAEASLMLEKAENQLSPEASCEQWIRAALQTQLKLK